MRFVNPTHAAFAQHSRDAVRPAQRYPNQRIVAEMDGGKIHPCGTQTVDLGDEFRQRGVRTLVSRRNSIVVAQLSMCFLVRHGEVFSWRGLPHLKGNEL